MFLHFPRPKVLFCWVVQNRKWTLLPALWPSPGPRPSCPDAVYCWHTLAIQPATILHKCSTWQQVRVKKKKKISPLHQWRAPHCKHMSLLLDDFFKRFIQTGNCSTLIFLLAIHMNPPNFCFKTNRALKYYKLSLSFSKGIYSWSIRFPTKT